ncbi:heparinase II/III domain-containing protein [Enterococcus massiliensis]|uniref:heparinase II/III domain-containing protein n=1 Tax=Enterococcus massiliensis TaxID=1640685 RepID=UPI00065E441D|nr:heparinase II/III family protein [Enterococcus massiliensis]
MNFQVIEMYHQSFFEEKELKQYQLEHSKFIDGISRRCEYLLKDKIIFTDSLDMEAVNVPYNLCYNNLLKTPNGDPEWIYMVSRNGFLVDLALMYRLTNEEKYLEKWKELLLTFTEWLLEDNPALWRNLDVGLRLSSWVKSCIYLGDLSKIFTLTEIKKIKNSFLNQTMYLETSFIDKNYLSNWGVLAITGLLNVAQLLPDIVTKKTENWAWSVLSHEMALQFYQDGIHWEQSPMYHHEVVVSVLQLWLNKQYTGCYFPKGILHYLKKAIQAAHYYCDSNGKLLSLNDSDAVDFSYIYSIYSLCGFLPRITSHNEEKIQVGYLYTGTKITHLVQESLPISFDEIDSGFMAYKEDTTFITLFNGRHGSGHGHAALGSLSILLKNQELIVDPGRYTYREDSKLRIQLKSEESHSSIMIDQKPSTRINGSWGYDEMGTPLASNTKNSKDLTEFIAVWSGWISENQLAIFKRKIVILKEASIVIVINTVECPGNHRLAAYYQLAPQIEVLKQEKLLFDKTSYQIFFSENQKESVEKGIYSEKYNQLIENKRIVLMSEFKDRSVTYEVFYDAEQYKIESLLCYQNKADEPAKTEQILGISIQHNQSSQLYEYYYSAFDTFRGDKLYHSETGRMIYGESNFFKENRK